MVVSRRRNEIFSNTMYELCVRENIHWKKVQNYEGGIKRFQKNVRALFCICLKFTWCKKHKIRLVRDGVTNHSCCSEVAREMRRDRISLLYIYIWQPTKTIVFAPFRNYSLRAILCDCKVFSKVADCVFLEPLVPPMTLLETWLNFGSVSPASPNKVRTLKSPLRSPTFCFA